MGMLGGQGMGVMANQAVEEDETEVAQREAEMAAILQMLLRA
jgi:hypothetical protein